MIHIVTLFAQNYMSRGLAMMESIQNTSSRDFKFTVLAMDNLTYEYMKLLRSKSLDVIHIKNFQDHEFQSLISTRPFRELCWTAASCLTNFVFNSDQTSDFIVYVDSDCYFFSDISKLVEKWNDKANIFVHEHRYSPGREQWEATAGRFNVGVVGFRRISSEAKNCLKRWRNQVLDNCELNPEKGLCGDQGYLDEWPNLYPSLHIMSKTGEGAAPWNIEPISARKEMGKVQVSGNDLIFYHFHALRLGFNMKFHIFVSEMAIGYCIPKTIKNLVYKPYLHHMRQIHARLRKDGFLLEGLGLAAFSAKDILMTRKQKKQMLYMLL